MNFPANTDCANLHFDQLYEAQTSTSVIGVFWSPTNSFDAHI